MKILLAVDGSPGSDVAVGKVPARPWPEGSSVKIIAVVELLTTVTPENFWVPDSYYLKLEQSLQTQARNAIERAEAQFQAAESPLEITTEIINGVAKEVIVEEADRWGGERTSAADSGAQRLSYFQK